MEEGGEALEEKLSNNAKRRRLDFAHERKLEQKLEADIEANKTRQLKRFKEKELSFWLSIEDDDLKYGKNFTSYSLFNIRQIKKYENAKGIVALRTALEGRL